MQIIRVNGYDMAYLTVGNGRPLVCVHGTLGDFRTWYPVSDPWRDNHRVITVSLRHFFPEHWDWYGRRLSYGATHCRCHRFYRTHIESKPVDLMGHSRGGHIAFRVAQQRPELLRKLVLAEPAGDLDASLAADNSPDAPAKALSRIEAAADKVRFGGHRRRNAAFSSIGSMAKAPLATPAGCSQAADARQRDHPAGTDQ